MTNVIHFVQLFRRQKSVFDCERWWAEDNLESINLRAGDRISKMTIPKKQETQL